MADEETSTDDTDETTDDKSGSDAAQQFDDDLAKWKSMSRKNEKAAKDAAKRAETAETELAQLRDASRSDQDKAIEAVRKEAADAAKTEAQAEIRAARLEAKVARAAAGKLTDPDDAIRFLDLTGLDPDDADGIADAIAELVKSKPYLAGAATAKPGAADQGARPASTKPAQLSRADLKTMNHHEIAKAKAEGRLTDLLAGNT